LASKKEVKGIVKFFELQSKIYKLNQMLFGCDPFFKKGAPKTNRRTAELSLLAGVITH
jgi:hypothetical protein